MSNHLVRKDIYDEWMKSLGFDSLSKSDRHLRLSGMLGISPTVFSRIESGMEIRYCSCVSIIKAYGSESIIDSFESFYIDIEGREVERYRDVCVVDGVLYDTYEISNYGRLLNKKTGHPLACVSRTEYVKSVTNKKKNRKYACISLRGSTGRVKAFRLHHLVLYVWRPELKRLPGQEGGHINDNQRDNYYLNLEWQTKDRQLECKVLNNKIVKGSDSKSSKLLESDVVEVFRLIKEDNKTVTEISRQFGVSWMSAYSIVLGYTWKHVPSKYREEVTSFFKGTFHGKYKDRIDLVLSLVDEGLSYPQIHSVVGYSIGQIKMYARLFRN